MLTGLVFGIIGFFIWFLGSFCDES